MVEEFLKTAAAFVMAVIAYAAGFFEDFPAEPEPLPALEEVVSTSTPPILEEVIYELLRESAEASTALAPTPTTPQLPGFPSFPVPTAPLPFDVPPTRPEEPVPAPPQAVETPEEVAASVGNLRNALVNIICTPAQGVGLRGTSGSGAIIDESGIIVTVAHVGVYFLLEDYPQKDAGDCIVRMGSPAKNAYEAELIYIPSAWVRENPTVVIQSTPRGTGENDFALLAITGSLSGGPLPSSFPSVRLAPEGADIDEGDRITAGSYGAEFLTSSEIRSSLYPTIAQTSVKKIWAFDGTVGNHVDLFSANAGAAAQQGSSGGAILNRRNQFIGVITTRTVQADLSLRDLQAISADHLRRVYRRETSGSLDGLLNTDTAASVRAFERRAPGLLDTVVDAITN